LTRFFATILSIKYGKSVDYEGDPFSYVFFPVFDTFIEETKEAVAVMFTAINWRVYFENLLPDNIVGVTLVLSNGCDEPFTYTINGHDVVFVGEGDLHDKNFDDMRRTTSFASLTNKTTISTTSLERNNFVFDSSECPYIIHVYPSEAYYNMHNTDTPAIITSAVAGIFVFTVLLFVAFDRLVECRQRILLKKATQTTEILSSIYPANIRDKLLAEHSTGVDGKKSENSDILAPNHRLKSFLNNSDKDPNSTNGLQASMQPLADLFPNTTVCKFHLCSDEESRGTCNMPSPYTDCVIACSFPPPNTVFADIAGFTAWSSVRDPAQVFILLQTLYGAFDSLAKSRKVFKIETIGDW
jgi:Adenylate and Guanylate cyclase catalytic domain